MYTLIALLFFAGFYLFYVTSKAVKRSSPLTKRLTANSVASRWIGCVFLLVGWALLVFTMGWGSGTFAVLAYAMCVGSLIVLLAPLGVIGVRQFILVVVLCFFLEFMIR